MLLGCVPARQPASTESVRLRLGAEGVDFDTAGSRGPSAAIGDEIRPVVAGVESILIFDPREVVSGANALELTVVVPDGAF